MVRKGLRRTMAGLDFTACFYFALASQKNPSIRAKKNPTMPHFPPKMKSNFEISVACVLLQAQCILIIQQNIIVITIFCNTTTVHFSRTLYKSLATAINK